MIFAATNGMFGNFAHDYTFIFVLSLILLGFSLFLMSISAFIIQAAVFVGMIVIDQLAVGFLYIPISIIQIIVGLYLIYRLKIAIDYNYRLVMEKTHQMNRHITKNFDSGSRNSFFLH